MKEHFPADKEVAKLLDGVGHEKRLEIESLRQIILNSDEEIRENFKWNGSNYTCKNEDRLTMRVNAPGKIQLIFHCGAKVKSQPGAKIISDDSGILEWRSNDRAIATFKNINEIQQNKHSLTKVIREWIVASFPTL